MGKMYFRESMFHDLIASIPLTYSEMRPNETNEARFDTLGPVLLFVND